MIQINYLNAFKGTAPRPGTPLRAFRGITIHDTGNASATADAKAHADLLRGSWQTRDTSWHYAVDDHSIYQSIPEEEVSWHAGDGANGVGNNETISIETCVNEGNDYTKTLWNTADLCADILKRKGIQTARAYLYQHYDFSPEKKNCPAFIRNNDLWEDVILLVQNRLDGTGGIPMANTHTIIRGDTLWALARAYGTTVDALKAANPSVDPNSLTIGSVINIPTTSPDVIALQARISDLEAKVADLGAQNVRLAEGLNTALASAAERRNLLDQINNLSR